MIPGDGVNDCRRIKLFFFFFYFLCIVEFWGNFGAVDSICNTF